MNGTKHANPRNGEHTVDGLAPAKYERRILILAPTGNDARLTAGFLANAKLSPHICRDVPTLCHDISRGCGAIVLAEETLGDSSIQSLVWTLAEQPSWSDVPIILITSGGEVSQTQLRRLAIFGPGGNVVLLERPFRPGTLISTLEVALRARQRQYEARDSVEELKRAHNEAQIASRAKDDFLAALSHELRTPLSPALLIASEAASNRELPEETRLDFETIRKNIELEARLIDDLLDITRISTGKMILNRDAVNVHGILTDTLDTIRAELHEKHIQFEMKLDAQQCTVNGDAVRLHQVFWNVLKNAVKFTPPHGKVVVESSVKEDNRLLIKITDTGIGMTVEEAGLVFNAFVQGEHAGKNSLHRFGGLGLGLAITKNLVELHSGTIVASSAGRNQGSTFIIELPLENEQKVMHQNGHSPAVSRVAAEIGHPPTSVLLVEDHEITREVLTRLLTRRNYKVITADSVVRAREVASQNKFDFLISDIGLPDGSGNDLMNELRESYGLKGIAVTGFGMENDIERGKAAGFVTHLTKPIGIQSLEAALSVIKNTI